MQPAKTRFGTGKLFEPKNQRALYLLGVGVWLAIVAAWAMPTVTQRHFQVDEFQNAYSSRLLVTSDLLDQTELFLVPLGYIAAQFEETSDVLFTFRGIFFLVFVVNLLLAAHAQYAFPTRLGRGLVLVAFSLLFPLWNFGMEIRHDNLLLTGQLALLLLTQRAAHRGNLRAGEAFWGGVAVFWTLIVAHKGFATALPFGALLLWVHRPVSGAGSALRERARLAGWLVLGGTVAAAVAAVFLAWSGHLGLVWRGAFGFAEHLEGLSSFSAWPSTRAEIVRYPLLFVAALGFLVAVTIEMIRRRPLSARLSPGHVAAIYLVWSFVVLSANPRPFPYNQLHFLPFVLFGALAGLAHLNLSATAARTALLALIVANGFGLVSGWSSEGYFRVTNEFQLAYIRAAEALTDPEEDSVLDGVGMVVTRKPPDRDWLVHSSYLSAYRRGERTSFSDLLESGASPVVMTNYRWGWLGEEVLSVLRTRYLPLANDFWVLGGRFEGREGSFEVHREGRYFMSSGTVQDPQGVVVDGMAATPLSVRFLPKGVHSFAGATDEGLVVGWVGPHLQAPVSLQSLQQGQFLLVPF